MSASSTTSTSNSSTSAQTHLAFSQQQNPAFGNVNSTLGGLPLQFFGQMGTGQLTFASEQMGNEISVIRYLDMMMVVQKGSWINEIT